MCRLNASFFNALHGVLMWVVLLLSFCAGLMGTSFFYVPSPHMEYYCTHLKAAAAVFFDSQSLLGELVCMLFGIQALNLCHWSKV